ncbi:MAG: OmpA family protein [Chitinophagaceae bacterium]|nr:OmpA family protein [Chitinophagaceae bacterium]MCW5926745.1 OmpA family protein [Chitinophagaceae bacterium]
MQLLVKYHTYISRVVIGSGIMLGICVANAGHAQGGTGYFVKAEKLFTEKKYYEAAQYYEKYLETEKGKTVRATPFAVSKKSAGKSNLSLHNEAVYRLAESYRKLNDYTKAEKYYSEAVLFSRKAYPAAQYWYGVSLRANQKYDEALQAFVAFQENYHTMDELLTGADKEIANLSFVKSQQERLKDKFTITKQTVNGTSAYAASLPVNNDEIYFTSIHTDLKAQKEKKDYYVARLYKSASVDNNVESAPERVTIPGEAGYNTGLATFAKGGKKMFFTKWSVEDGETVSAIYSSEKTDTGWSKPVRLPEPVNVKGANSTQPFVTVDESYLLFSSDRKGGVGKYDLWFAHLDRDCNVLKVTNMGNMINTPGDDLAPSYHTLSRHLFYSSNGRVGMGGFDIYYARGDFQLLNWETPENAGAPINSSRDDLYYVPTDEINPWNTGLLSSDRDTDCCLDLYSVKQNNKQFVSGLVLDCETRRPVVDAIVTVKDNKRGKILLSRSTGADGSYSFELNNTSQFDIVAEKKGFETANSNFILKFTTEEEHFRNRDICLSPVEIRPSIPEVDDVLASLTEASTLAKFSFNKYSLNQSYYQMLDSLVAIMDRYPGIVIEIGGHTDSKGSEEYNLKLAESRVNACIQYLVRKGVSRSRLVGKAYGECCPLEPEYMNGEDNPAGRERNRRVEYKLLQGNLE